MYPTPSASLAFAVLRSFAKLQQDSDLRRRPGTLPIFGSHAGSGVRSVGRTVAFAGWLARSRTRTESCSHATFGERPSSPKRYAKLEEAAPIEASAIIRRFCAIAYERA